MRDDRDFIGALAQNGVNEWLENREMAETFPFFIPGIYRDECDYILDGRNDIKGSGFKAGYQKKIYPETHFLVRNNYANQAEKHGIRRYTFVRVDPDGMQLHIAGVIGRGRFDEISRPEPGAQYPARYVLAKWLDCFQQFVYHTKCDHPDPYQGRPRRYR